MQIVTVSINGVNDVSVIAGTNVATITEDSVSATGTLTISDVDYDHVPIFEDVSLTDGSNRYGSFTLVNGVWNYILDQDSVQALDTGDSVTDSIVFTASDGSTQQVSVVINGSDEIWINSFEDNAEINGTEDDDNIYIGADNNIVNSYLGDDYIYTEYDNNIINAGDGNDEIQIWGDNNILDAGDGDDDISIGGVDNQFTGGSGSDFYTVGAALERGSITDFSVEDVIDLQITDFRGFSELNFYYEQTDLILSLSETQIINLGNTDLSSLSDENFIFKLPNSEEDDVIFDRDIEDYIVSGAGNDLIIQSFSEWNTIESGEGDDLIYIASGSSDVSTGNGNDVIVVSNREGLFDTIYIDDFDIGNDVVDLFDVASIASFDDILSSATIYYRLVENEDGVWHHSDTESVNITIDNSTLSLNVSLTDLSEDNFIFNNINYASRVYGEYNSSTNEDNNLLVSGSLSIVDIDEADTPTFSDIPSVLGDNSYGTFSITNGVWSYILNQASVQDLDLGDSVEDRISFIASDGSVQIVTVSINGANDVSVIAGTDVATITEDSISATGTLTISDVDSDDAPTFTDIPSVLGDNSYGTFSITNGVWSYILNQASVQDLDLGNSVEDRISFTASDGSVQIVTVSINGANDVSVIAGTNVATITEDSISATGTLTISDVDSDDAPTFTDIPSVLGDNSYGTFSITNGVWSYILNQASVQDLDLGNSAEDRVSFTASDGSVQIVTVSINGANDVSVIAGTNVATITEDSISATGTLTISDVDSDDTPTFSDIPSVLGDNSYGTFSITNGVWSYILNQASVQDLDLGDSVEDRISFIASDGSVQIVTVSINGANDVSVIAGTDVATITEDSISATGTLTISDVDSDDAPTFTDIPSVLGDNSYGTFSITNGVWSYILNQASVQDLDLGDSVEDRISFIASDGSVQIVTVSINGANDVSEVIRAVSPTTIGTSANDSIIGSINDDLIIGGAGDDVLSGDRGHDIYEYSLEDGVDIINEYALVGGQEVAYEYGYDKVRFEEEIDLSNVFLARSGEDLLLKFTDSEGDFLEGNLITVENHFLSETHRLEKIEFGGHIIFNVRDLELEDGVEISLISQSSLLNRGVDNLGEEDSHNELGDLIGELEALPTFEEIDGQAVEVAEVLDEVTTVQSSGEVKVKFKNSVAGYQNSLGFYVINSNGSIENPQLLFKNAKILEAGTEFSLGILEEGQQVGFFLIANGGRGIWSAEDDATNRMSMQNLDLEQVTFSFVDAEGENAAISSETAPQLLLQKDGVNYVINKNIYHSDNNENLNPDSVQHGGAGWDSEEGKLLLGFEDLLGGGDRDYNDLLFHLDLGEGNNQVPVYNNAPSLNLDLNINNLINSASISISNNFAVGDKLTFQNYEIDDLGNILNDGIDSGINLLAEEDGLLELSGEASSEVYQSILNDIALIHIAGEGEELDALYLTRTISVNISDDLLEIFNEEIDIIVTKSPLIGTDGADILSGTAANDILIGGEGADLLTGGAGQDYFIFAEEDSSINATDEILDFETGIDHIDLSNTAIDFENLTISFDEEGDSIIEDSQSDFALKINGEYALAEDDFII